MKTDSPILAWSIQSVKTSETVYDTLKNLFESKDHYIESELSDRGLLRVHPGTVGWFLGVDIEMQVEQNGSITRVDIAFARCSCPLRRFFVRQNGKSLVREIESHLNTER